MKSENIAVLLLLLGSMLAVGGATAAAQDDATIEASLRLDRPARRLVQQGLRNEGFDPGAPDGLFGPRTRAAIRAWQQARGLPATGYLDSPQVNRLRAGGTPKSEPNPAAAVPTAAAPPVEEQPTNLVRAVSCETWNTVEFFESATAATATACLAAGRDVAARDGNGATPLHLAALSSPDPTVVEALLTAGADLEALDNHNNRPLNYAARSSGNPAVTEALLGAGADPNVSRPLVQAVLSDDPAIVDALIAAGADVNVRGTILLVSPSAIARFRWSRP